MRRLVVALLAATAMSVTANAADMPVKAPVFKAPPPLVFNWTGFYFGINGGWARDKITTSAVNYVQPDKSGGAVGGQVGFNWQWQQIVLGAEFDGDWLGLKGSDLCFNPTFTCTTKVNYQVSVRGRLGVAFDRWLVYGTGGAAWTTFKGSTYTSTTTYPGSTSRNGWIAGGGVEYAVWNNLILGVEYLHADFGTKDQIYDVTYPDVKLTTDIVRARLSYLFNTP